MTRDVLVSLLIAIAAVLAGCTGPEEGGPTTTTPTQTTPTPDDEPGEIQEVDVVASNYEFDAPDSLTAGLVRFTLTNAATDEFHHVQLVQLAPGNTTEDLVAFFNASGHASTPPWTGLWGGPNAPLPANGTNAAVVDLEAGTYAYACFIPSADGIPHVVKGMAAPLNVTAASGNAAEPPEADVTVSLSEFNFTFDANDTVGNVTVAFENDGTLTHEAFIARLAEGKTGQDLLAFFSGQGPPGPPPIVASGGITSMEPGQTSYVDFDFQAGTYVFMCFDEAGGAPHFTKGMLKEFTVT